MSKETHWESSSEWYNKLVGKEGHYYHKQIILPHLVEWIKTTSSGKLSVLDLACGQGVLSHHIPKKAHYVGVDGSASLINSAKRSSTNRSTHSFFVHDLCKPLSLPIKDFSHATCILAAQNIEDTLSLFKNACLQLKPGGLFSIVLNHPCFRIPRQSSWGFDEPKQCQFRRVDRYMSPLKIPLQTHPGKKELSETTWSFHRPLSFFMQTLSQAGFVLIDMQEWCSDKKSTGKRAKAENRSRNEFPLFLTLFARKEKP